MFLCAFVPLFPFLRLCGDGLGPLGAEWPRNVTQEIVPLIALHFILIIIIMTSAIISIAIFKCQIVK